MKTIYWTYKHFNNEKFKEHDHYGKHCVVVLAPEPDGWFVHCFSDNGKFSHFPFDTKEEAYFFVNELNKPEYAKVFGSSYKLVELKNNSKEWFAVWKAWQDFLIQLSRLKEFYDLPWYKKWFVWIKGILCNKNPLWD